ncbi:MAG TPA: type 4a pilus biogenesis protein PilO [Phycisphaerae bacterium]|nr:type 4a pilus biogenesis protein PilO [Phycisphaerae bacterium]
MLKLNVAAVVAVIVLTAAFVLGLVRPGIKDLKACQAEIVAKQAAVQAEQQKLGNVGDLYASIMQLDEAMRDFHVRLPVERRFGEFLSDLSESLNKSKIDDYVVQPRQPLCVEQNKLPEPLKLASGTTILPVFISFRSSFTQLFEFLSRVESLPRLSHIESIRAVNDDQHPGTVSVEMTLHTYQHHEGSVPGKPG